MSLPIETRTQILTEPKITSTTVQKHKFNIDARCTGIFKLQQEDLAEILEAVNQKFLEIEKSAHKAAGYELHFITKKNRPIEIILEACGEREADQEMQMPQFKGDGCPFCKSTEVMPGCEGLSRPEVKVIKSLGGNPLTITQQHAQHFFDMPISSQKEMIMTASKVLEKFGGTGASNSSISAHIGMAGHQTVSHAHLHILASLG